jgi:predicted RNA-binding Zn-ribbon protein involved in translation (DUF1610 family)
LNAKLLNGSRQPTTKVGLIKSEIVMENKSLVDWISICPKCESENILVNSISSETVKQGQKAECENCGLNGLVEVYGPEECDVAWDEE